MSTSKKKALKYAKIFNAQIRASLSLYNSTQQSYLLDILFTKEFKSVLLHSHYVGILANLIYKKLLNSNPKVKNFEYLPACLIYLSGLLHDVGKKNTAILSIINKPSFLNKKERIIVKKHTNIGYKILKEINVQPKILEVAINHHESWDGNGYPNHIKGNKIPFLAQIIGLADYLEACMEVRPYNQIKKSYIQAFDEIEKAEMNQRTIRFQPEIFETARTLRFEIRD